MVGEEDLTRVALIGTGIMGAPMARRLAAAGLDVAVWNRTPAKAEALGIAGIPVHETITEAVKGRDLVVVMVSSGPVVEAVVKGPDGCLAHMRPGAVLAIMSSISVETMKSVAEAARARGIDCIDAPVSGGERGAIAGTLSIMVGGDVAAFDRVRPTLVHMGRPTHIGPVGSGQLAKLCNQLIVASTICAVAEGLVLAEKGGADPARVREALLGGFADSTILRQHGERMVKGDFVPGGPAKYQLKDTNAALALAAAFGLDLPVAQTVDGLFARMIAAGDGDLDHSAVIRHVG
jgi:2-hydroxy-3-oxopropionate reductase